MIKREQKIIRSIYSINDFKKKTLNKEQRNNILKIGTILNLEKKHM